MNSSAVVVGVIQAGDPLTHATVAVITWLKTLDSPSMGEVFSCVVEIKMKAVSVVTWSGQRIRGTLKPKPQSEAKIC